MKNGRGQITIHTDIASLAKETTGAAASEIPSSGTKKGLSQERRARNRARANEMKRSTRSAAQFSGFPRAGQRESTFRNLAANANSSDGHIE
jgi:hypothetical protein